MKYKPKSNTGFARHTQTPLSTCLALSVHNKVRSKVLVNFLSELNLGDSYNSVLKLEKRVECGVAEQMKFTGGYCLPPFVKKGKSIFFAVDNIDFLEDTYDGQNTLHGTVVVVNQEHIKDGELVNKPIIIPDKITPVELEIFYHAEPPIFLKPIKCLTYEFNSRSSLLDEYKMEDRSWLLACHLSNDVQNSSSKCLSRDDQTMLNTAAGRAPDNIDSAGTYEDGTTEESFSTVASNIESIKDACDPILHMSTGTEKKEDSRSTHVMPTWSATNSLLLQLQKVKLATTNTDVVAPLFRQSPTDYATLYTVLSLTQNISAVVVGKDKKTVRPV